MTAAIDDYLDRVTSFYRDRPRYIQTLTVTIQPFVDAINFARSISSYFDIDDAVGAQLDVVGEWVGRSRHIPLPLQTCFFTFGDPLRGFGRGIWYNQQLNPGVTFATLDDDSYRRLLKAKAVANEWDGTVVGAAQALELFLPSESGAYLFVDDKGAGIQGGDYAQMGVVFGISGKIPSLVDLEILSQNLLGLKPAGVSAKYAVTSVDGAPVFGFGADNEFIGGFGRGAWSVDPSTLAASDPTLIATG